MHRPVLLAALTVAGGLAVAPAYADYPPTDCYATLVLAAKDDSSGCNTIGSTTLVNSNRRELKLYVQTGAATATLGCGGDTGPEYATVTVAAPYSATAYVNRTTFCWVTVTALFDGTTAVVSNMSSHTID